MLSHLQFPIKPRAFPKPLRYLFFSKLLRSIGLQFDTFFMPLFLYQLGVKFQPFPISSFQNGMILLGMYFLFERISVLFLTLPASQLIVRFGIRNSMILSQVLYVITLVLYIFSQKNPVYLLPILVIEGARLPLFWCSFFSLFSMNAYYKRMGESVGTIEFFTKLVGAAIPAISGFIIVNLGFSYIFYISLFFQGLAILTLFFVTNKEKITTPTLIELKAWLKERQFRMLSLSMGGKYGADVMQGLWPLFVLLLIGTADKVGYLYFVVFFVSLLLTYFTGWFVDHSKSRRPFSITGSILSGLWVVRSFISSAWAIMAVDIFGNLANSIYSPFYTSIMMRRGKGDSALHYYVYRELIISFTGVIFWGGFILFFMFSTSWRSFLLLGAVAGLMSMLLQDKHAEPATVQTE